MAFKNTNLKEISPEDLINHVSSVDGMFSIVGFGSLLSIRSASMTFPTLENFRICRLYGFRRVFAHLAPIFFERGIAKTETGEVASLSVEEADDSSSILVTQFEIPSSMISSFVEREHEFRFVSVVPEPINLRSGETFEKRHAVVCCRYSDEEYRELRCADDNEYYQRYGRFGIDKIWRDDVLPCRVYLRHCVLAARNLQSLYDEVDDECLDTCEDFLKTTFLADRKTTIEEHLANNPDIMATPPPPTLVERYSG